MHFSTKIVAFAVIPAFLFILGLASSIGSLLKMQSEFDRYIKSEQAVDHGLSDMYAQGLQMGQALRNVVLDPKNPKAYDNLKAAQSAYDQAFIATQASAKGSSFESALTRLPALREAQAKAQATVLALVAGCNETPDGGKAAAPQSSQVNTPTPSASTGATASKEEKKEG